MKRTSSVKGDAAFNAERLAQAVSNSIRGKGVTLARLVYESAEGPKIVRCADDFPNDIADITENLRKLGRSIAVDMCKYKHAPQIFYPRDPRHEKDDLVLEIAGRMQAAGYECVYLFPIRDFRGNLFVPIVASQRRVLSLMEAGLMHHSFLDAADAVSSPIEERLGSKTVLTMRERQCLVAAANGLTEKQTGQQLSISPNTVHAHLQNCKRKLKTRTKLGTVIKGLQTGEITFLDIQNL